MSQLVTIYFHKDDLINGETNVSVVNKLKAKQLQTGGRLISAKEIRSGWIIPNADALKLILRLRRKFPWLKFDFRKYLDFKQNLKTPKEIIFKIASNSPTLWEEFVTAWKDFEK